MYLELVITILILYKIVVSFIEEQPGRAEPGRAIYITKFQE